jgi:hypothetical protein
MTDDVSPHRERSGLAVAFGLCALATLTLLANHPNGGRHSVADFINDEAHNQFVDGLVHGGFIVTLSALIVCFVLLSRWLDSTRVPVVIGLVAFCVGCGALMASMILDGFATPAIAARFIGTDSTDNLATAQTLFILCGTLIRFLMPTGLLFQSVAMLSWSSVIVRGRGLRRSVGVFGFGAALLLIVALFAVPATMATHVLLGGIVLQAIWYVALAVLLFSRAAWPYHVQK